MNGTKNLLVTCVGAYHDSGIGTGGFVCVKDKKATVIDHLDSTGLAELNGEYFRFVRALRALVVYSDAGIKRVIYLRDVNDAHDVLVTGEQIVCVSTGTNEVIFYDHQGNLQRRIRLDGSGDAWHLNCLCMHNDKLYLAAFGKFKTHREWNEKGCKEQGIVFDVETAEPIVGRLTGPHHPRFVDGRWLICNSHMRSLRAVESNGEFRDIVLGGFTRGINLDEKYIYVGVNADRKATVPQDHSLVKVLDRQTLAVVDEIAVPFPEIYDIVFVSDRFVENAVNDPAPFRLFKDADGTELLREQVKLGLDEVNRLRGINEQLRKQLNGQKPGLLSRVKNKMGRLFGS